MQGSRRARRKFPLRPTASLLVFLLFQKLPQLLTPMLVAMAVSTDITIWMMVFHVSFLIIALYALDG